MADTRPLIVINLAPLLNETLAELEQAELQLRAAQSAVDKLQGRKELLLELMQPQPEILTGEDAPTQGKGG